MICVILYLKAMKETVVLQIPFQENWWLVGTSKYLRTNYNSGAILMSLLGEIKTVKVIVNNPKVAEFCNKGGTACLTRPLFT